MEPIVLRERGCMRIPAALFLAVWLCGWGAGEWFAGRAFVWMLLQEKIPASSWVALPFVTIWLAFWSVAGAAALVSLLRMLAGRDELHLAADAWRVRRTVAGIGTTRVLPLRDIRAVFISHAGAVTAELEDRDVVLTRYGTKQEKEAIVSRFPRPGTPGEPELPRGWRAVRERGAIRIERREVEGRGCLVFCVVVAMAAIALVFRIDEPPRLAWIVALTVAALSGGLAVWGAFSRRGWRVAPDRVASWLTFAGLRRETHYDRDSLSVTRHRDSDGDEHVALTATVRGRKRKLLREMNDERSVMRLGRFLARHAGWTLRT